MTLSEYMVEMREKMGWSQRELGKKSNVSHQTISLYEKGINPATGNKITPDFITLKKIATAFGVDLHQMMKDVDDCYVDIGFPEMRQGFHPDVIAMLDARINESTSKDQQDDFEYNNEMELIEIYRKLSNEGREYLLQQAEIALRAYGERK